MVESESRPVENKVILTAERLGIEPGLAEEFDRLVLEDQNDHIVSWSPIDKDKERNERLHAIAEGSGVELGKQFWMQQGGVRTLKGQVNKIFSKEWLSTSAAKVRLERWKSRKIDRGWQPSDLNRFVQEVRDWRSGEKQ